MPVVSRLDVSVFEVPLPEPEADGTFAWDRTTVVVVQPCADDVTGIGFTYGSAACARVVEDSLRSRVVGRDASDVAGAWHAMIDAVRNIGRPGVASMAIAAVDCALWDLKAKLAHLPLVDLLGGGRDAVDIYGSGGFTSLSEGDLCAQLAGWVDEGIPRVKMKIGTDWGRDPRRDVQRVTKARDAIGGDAELFVDANGGYTPKQAARLCAPFEECDVRWFEEPVSSDDLDGLATVRDATTIEIAAGEYGFDLRYFERMLAHGAVDVIQADVSRCAGVTEWLRVAAVAAAHGCDVSGHCAQSLHVHPACTVPNLRHLEYFADHAYVDRELFDGVLTPAGGQLRPDRSQPGFGLALRGDATRYRVL